MTIAKRHAVVLMLSLRSQKYNNLREKNRAVKKWVDYARDAKTFTLQLEISRLAKEVENIKFHEELLKTEFSV